MTKPDATCACTAWRGRHASFVPIFPDDVFETLERQDAGLDLHGAVPHSGRVRCRSCGRVYTYDNTLSGCTFELEQRLEIVLIGPVAVGKTSVARCLTARLGVPMISMDDLRDGYYREIGYDDALAKRLFETQGAATLWCYCKVFDPYSVERLLAEHKNCIFDMGGGSSVHEHDDQLERVKRAFAAFPNVMLLLPSSDVDASLALLDQRTGWGGKPRNVNRILLTHRSNAELAKHVVYTAGRTPEQIAEEIISRAARPD